jgi:TonB family protein
VFVNVFLRRFLPFCLAVACGLSGVIFGNELFPRSVDSVKDSSTPDRNPGSASSRQRNSRFRAAETTGYGSSGSDDSAIDDDSLRSLHSRRGTNKVNLLFKPKATYTDAARQNNIEGAVRLKLTLLANGQVGSITPVTRLPDGLTEQAIAAARQIKFEPKTVNGVPVSVVVTIDYGFSIY